MDWSQRLSQLSPGQYKLLQQKLEERNVDILQLPITPLARNEGQRFPLSFGQQRLWFVQQLDTGNFAYNIIRAVRLEGILDKLSLERGLNEIVRRHEILRTQFMLEQEKPFQYILPGLSVPLEAVDLKNLPGQHQEQEVRKIIAAENRRPFDLAGGPLLRTKLLVLNENVHVFLLVIHHIISDGISMQILIQELVRLYEAFSRGNRLYISPTMPPSSLPELPVQYVDYACWQRQWFGDDAFNYGNGQKQETYWLKQFVDDIPLLTLPADYPRPVMQSFAGSQFTYSLAAHETRALKQLVLREKSTLYILLLAIYNIFLAKLGGMEDIVVGTPVSGRRHPALQKLIGMFANMLALRNLPNRQKTFAEFLGEVKEQTLSAFENQEYRYEDIVDKLNINRSTSRNPLFDVVFLLDSNDLERFEINLPGLNLKSYKIDPQTSKFDLSLIALEEEDRLEITFEFCTKLFKEATVERFAGYFKEISAAVVKNSGVEIGDIDIIPVEEKTKILFEFNRTEAQFPADKAIHQLLACRVDKTPDRVALVFEASNLSYRQLDQKAQKLAITLRNRGLETGGIVMIMMNPSLDLVIGVIGIMKAGGAYLPVTPDYPRERIDYMLKDSGAILLVTTSDKEGEKVRRWEGEKVLLEEISQSPKNFSYPLTFLPSYLLSLSNIAYIIYTSGSTGGPKGVMVEHRAVVNILWDLFRRYPLEEGDAYLFKTAFTFDVSVSELFGWFWRGGRLVILNNDDRKDPEKIIAAAAAHHITHINFVPPMFSLWLEFLNEAHLKKLGSLKYIFVAGEALLPRPVLKFKSLGTRIILENIYGPTEATIYASRYSLAEWDGDERVPIGKALANIELLVLDRNRNLQPVGVAGELYIAGLGLARGYLNNPELTAERFIHFHHSSFDLPRIHHSKLYCTGDLVRWLPDGNIEYFGRIDQQVKIRGFRIEPGEIENRLLKYPIIKEAVVLVREDETKDKYLIAYFVAAAAGKEIRTVELKQYLAQQLPDYMIPGYFMQIEKIPLNPSGKVDRKALPAPGLTVKGSFAAPTNEIEARLVDIWSKVLGIENSLVSIDSNFFELGGHSLKAAAMISRIHKELDVKIPLLEIFKAANIRALSKYIGGLKKELYLSIEPVEKKDYYILSPAQKRLFILQQMEVESTTYNMPRAFLIGGELDTGKLETVFEMLIDRHESLRTSFHMIDNEPLQRVHDGVKFQIEQLESRGDPPWSPFIRPFDLSKAPLLRVGLIKEAETEHVLLVDMHHIISDGISHDILAGDFFNLYNCCDLEPVRIQYKDFAEWQNSEKEKEKLKKQETFWLKIFVGEIPVLNLFTDFPRPPVQSFAGSTVGFELPADAMKALRHIAVTGGVTLYMILLAVYNVLLAKLTNREDIITGTPTAGRGHADLERTIGMFVNTLALRNYPEGHKGFMDFLMEVKARTLEAFENQEYQFENLVEKVLVNRDPGRNPIFDTVFTLQSLENRDKKIPRPETSQLDIKPYEIETGISKFDLILTCIESEEKAVCTFDYCTKLFKEETIRRFTAYFRQVVSAIIEDRNREISYIEIITAEEKEQILHEFNDATPPYPREKTVLQIFEEQAIGVGDRIAVV
ncbi:MAG: amino acid adenylation domain-containing protein, partial [Candidatus Aminicenantes bacterium]|nr:amino acid adenylation domain-containing protein [Candidatus Aminicenantes bacterium]